jgi:hypothetical protein
VPGIYLASIFGQVQGMPVSEVAYQESMLRTVGIAITLLIVAHIAIAIAAPREADKSDQRDREINRYGEYVGSFVLAGLTTSAVKIVAYRRGFQSW